MTDLIQPRVGFARLPERSSAAFLPPVIGHRGAAGRAPENTLAGFRRARELGCLWIEFDVRLSADGVAVVCHDPRLDRTTSGSGLISALGAAAIREFDAGGWFDPVFAGERVPTLDEVLLLAAELGLGANIEIKADRGREYATAAAVAAMLKRLGGSAPPALVSSFQAGAVAALRGLAPQVPRGILFRLVPRGWAEIAGALGCVMVGADHRRLRPRRIAAIRAAGYALAAFTVNNPVRARQLFDWGVTSVFSDLPDIILRIAAGHGAARAATTATPQPIAARQGAFR